ncbi:hypothetical protein LCGC14_2465140 [marine sediment metagenome]|uniref:SprT-like domain-containing protein n=1 Tax=marine sediment metagenome TaxID=412755 RepID=A0A0F9BCM4_9ZZZZ
MTKQDKDFTLFQKYFKEYQRRFGLNGYSVYFKYEPLSSGFANISTNQGEMVVTVRLNSRLPRKDKPFKDIKQSAKHEALHLLLCRLEQNGRYRFIAEGEIYEATEEVVHRLEGLIE